MNMKRVLTAVIGFPIVVAVLVLCNKYIIDVVVTIAAFIAMHEYIKCVGNKDVHVIKWVSYLSVSLIAFAHLFSITTYMNIILICIPILLLILFFHVIVTNMKITLNDIVYTLFGIVYIFTCLVCLALTFGIEGNISGKIVVWYILLSAWGTDVFAYIIGKKFGKTKFSKVSPNKSIEGCVSGTIGAICVCLLYTLGVNYFAGLEISYILIAGISLVLSIVGQIGDFSASVIKRHFEVKDYSNLFPGHGGMLDRIDSVMFIAPFAYMLFLIIL